MKTVELEKHLEQKETLGRTEYHWTGQSHRGLGLVRVGVRVRTQRQSSIGSALYSVLYSVNECEWTLAQGSRVILGDVCAQ